MPLGYQCFKLCSGMPWGLLVPPFFSEGKRGDRFENLCFKVCFARLGDYRFLVRYLCFKNAFACLGDYRYLTLLGLVIPRASRVSDTGLVMPRAGDVLGW